MNNVKEQIRSRFGKDTKESIRDAIVDDIPPIVWRQLVRELWDPVTVQTFGGVAFIIEINLER